jgi:hypothetical protein
VLLSVSSNPAFTNLAFLANAITAVALQGENIAVDSRIPVRTLGGFANITYYLMNGALVMQSPAVLRIDPGVVIKNQLNSGGIQIDGALVADGKVDSVIVFTSERDDAYGNPADTNGDGSSTSPAQGNWYYLRITAGSNDAVTKLDYCRIAYGSQGPFDGWPTSLWLQSADHELHDCQGLVGHPHGRRQCAADRRLRVFQPAVRALRHVGDGESKHHRQQHLFDERLQRDRADVGGRVG